MTERPVSNRDLRKLELGREAILQLTSLFKTLRLYDRDNDAVRNVTERILQTVLEVAEGEGELQVAVRGGALFVDRLRIREGAVGASSYHQLIDLLRSLRMSSLSIDTEVRPSEIEVLGTVLLEAVEKHYTPEELVRELRVQGAVHVEIEFGDDDVDLSQEVDAEQVAKRVYLRSIGVLKGIFYEARSRNRINGRRVKRVVQEMMDSLDGDPGYLLNLTSVKNYDEYTFNHSVNVGILAVGLGRAIGLSRRQLYVLGQAGMLHDLGKLCVPKEILNKPGRLTPEERALIQSHPAEGFISIATKQGVTAETVAVALAAYEHHMNLDGSGYPAGASSRPIGLTSRLVAIVDRYDAMTSARIYRSKPIPPPKALSIMFNSQRSQVDQLLLRYFMNMVGHYPLGTAVRLSDMSVAIVVGAGSDPELRHLPVVKLVLDPGGQPASGDKLDLAALAKGGRPLNVVETLDAADYGIEVMDYIL